MRNSTAAALRSLYIRENVTRARAIGRHCSWFALSFCVSFETRSVSALGSVLFCFLLCLLWFRLDIAPFSSLLRLLSSLLFLCLWSLTVSPTLLTSAPRPSTLAQSQLNLRRLPVNLRLLSTPCYTARLGTTRRRRDSSFYSCDRLDLNTRVRDSYLGLGPSSQSPSFSSPAVPSTQTATSYCFVLLIVLLYIELS